MAPCTVVRSLPYQLTIKIILHKRTHGPIWSRKFLTPGSYWVHIQHLLGPSHIMTWEREPWLATDYICFVEFKQWGIKHRPPKKRMRDNPTPQREQRGDPDEQEMIHSLKLPSWSSREFGLGHSPHWEQRLPDFQAWRSSHFHVSQVRYCVTGLG